MPKKVLVGSGALGEARNPNGAAGHYLAAGTWILPRLGVIGQLPSSRLLVPYPAWSSRFVRVADYSDEVVNTSAFFEFYLGEN